MTSSAVAFKTFGYQNQHVEFMAFVSDEPSQAALSDFALQHWPASLVKEGGIAAAIQALSVLPSPRLLLVDVSQSSDPVADVQALMELCSPATSVIVAGAANDVKLYRELIAVGVADYLVKPLDNKDLHRALVSAVRPEEPEAEATEPGQVWFEIGTRGGVGSSTVAINTAWLAATELGALVALVDLDLHFGISTLTLDVEPSRGMREALKNPGRVDDLFIERAMVRAHENLFVLGTEEGLDGEIAIDPAAIDHLVGELRRKFDCVVIDLPRAQVVPYRRVLAAAQRITLVTDFTLVGMRDTLRLLALVRGVVGDSKLTVVANRVGRKRKTEMSADTFVKNAEVPIDVTLPDEPESALKAAQAGKPLATTASKALKGPLLGLARALVAREVAENKAPFWKRLLKRR